MALAVDLSKLLEKGGGAELDRKVSYLLWPGDGCFSERGDSNLSFFSWESLRAKLQDN